MHLLSRFAGQQGRQARNGVVALNAQLAVLKSLCTSTQGQNALQARLCVHILLANEGRRRKEEDSRTWYRLRTAHGQHKARNQRVCACVVQRVCNKIKHSS